MVKLLWSACCFLDLIMLLLLTQSTVCARVLHWSWRSSRWVRIHRRIACNALHWATCLLPGLCKFRIRSGLDGGDNVPCWRLLHFSLGVHHGYSLSAKEHNLRAGREARNWTKQWELSLGGSVDYGWIIFQSNAQPESFLAFLGPVAFVTASVVWQLDKKR